MDRVVRMISNRSMPWFSFGTASSAGARYCFSRACYAFYEFADVAHAEALIGSDKIKPVVADFDRVWGDRVSRHREVLEIVQELVV